MFTFPNILSFLRIPLALVFIQTSNPLYRALAILCAMATDGLDGFLARRYQLCNRFGSLLDPVTDKFFVFFVLSVLVHEQKLTLFEASLLISRDFSVIFYGLYLALRGRLFHYRVRAIWCGKITTVLQFIILLGLTCQMEIPSYVYGIFIILGVMALIELYIRGSGSRNQQAELET